MGFLDFLLGSTSESKLKKLRPRVDRINALEETYRAMSDEQLRNCTAAFRARLAAGETLDDLLCDAFAAVREAAVRTVGMRHFDVQLLGGMVLHQGRIAEMKTGEGKTLVATLPAYLNALEGRGVHIVTVNDYLANGILRPGAQFTAEVRIGIQCRNLDTLGNHVGTLVYQDTVARLHDFHGLVDGEQRSILRTLIIVVAISGYMDVIGRNGHRYQCPHTQKGCCFLKEM